MSQAEVGLLCTNYLMKRRIQRKKINTQFSCSGSSVLRKCCASNGEHKPVLQYENIKYIWYKQSRAIKQPCRSQFPLLCSVACNKQTLIEIGIFSNVVVFDFIEYQPYTI